MSIPGLTIIGETINDSVPSTHKLFEDNNIRTLGDFVDRVVAEYNETHNE